MVPSLRLKHIPRQVFIAKGDRVDILQRGSQIVYASNRTVTNVDFINSTLLLMTLSASP